MNFKFTWIKAILGLIPAFLIGFFALEFFRCTPSCGFIKEKVPAIIIFVITYLIFYISYSMNQKEAT